MEQYYEVHYKFLHRITVTKKELCLFRLKQDHVIVYIVERKTPSCIHFQTAFQRGVTQKFDNVNYTNQHSSVEETLFGHFPTYSIANKTMSRKLDYTLLYMRYYIYTSKLHNRSITLSYFVTKLNAKYNVKNIE